MQSSVNGVFMQISLKIYDTRYDRSTNFLELDVNVARTIGILRDAIFFSRF